ncbi:mechanosensitive ion channel [Akkermansiaceae bacterium]|nr:mechanosensitive ion channel [Akkermansiaceae bacterium]
MAFDARLAEAVGLAAGIYLCVWLAFRFGWKKADKPPGISLQVFALALGLWVSGRAFYPQEAWMGHLGAVLVFCGTLFAWVMFDRGVTVGWLEKRRKVAMPIILRQLAGAIVVLGAGAAILKWGYGLELTGLVATSGVAAVILGFAMQDLLGNVIAGFSIHMTSAYKVGDWLLLGESGKRAEVAEINWRSTRLIDNDRVSHEIPNSEMVKNRIVNLNHPGAEHGVRLRLGLDYDTPPALAKEVLIKCAKTAQGVLESPEPVVFLIDFGDSSITYELRFWMRHARLYNVTCDEIRTALWYELGRRDMRIPFPIRSLETRTPNVPQGFVTARKNATRILRGSGMFNSLAQEEAEKLISSGRFLVFGPREALVTRGEPGESMFLILEGSVEVIAKASDGPRVVLATLSSGDCFGEMSLVTGEPRNATVRAAGDVLVLEISKAQLSPLMAERPELAESMGRILEKRRLHREESLTGAGAADTKESGRKKADPSSLVRRIRHFFGHLDA